MSKLKLDVDQAGELKAAFRRGFWTNDEIKKACEGDFLVRTRQVLLGHAEIKLLPHFIDCDADPFVPRDDWKVEVHNKGGRFLWDPSKVRLHLSEYQKGGKVIKGEDLRVKFKNEPMFNANLLDYLLKNPYLIPEEWKQDEAGNGRYIFFWGTVYATPAGFSIRFLYFHEGLWGSDHYWFDYFWGGECPAARLVG